MTGQTFATWVRPVAAALAEDRRQVIAFARTAPADLWDRASDVEGWTHRDILAHLAGGNDRMVQAVLHAVVAQEALDPALLEPDTDAENARGVAERRSWPLDRLVAELERDGEEMQELLSRLTDDDRNVRLAGTPMRLGDFLRIVEHERHDKLHVEQMRAGLDAQGR